jgi:penicillin amidase
MKRLLRYLLVLLIATTALILAGGLYARSRVSASLPMVDGTAAVPGLAADVTIVRDRLGVPSISGQSRTDVARGLGFVHAQDRFFQMDLQRRQPAGELAALVGPRGLPLDEDARVHRFRDIARRAFEQTDPVYRSVLEAYAGGVNAGLDALAAAPPEYFVLQAVPEPWRPEDSILTVLAMFDRLQGRQAGFEQTMGTMRDALPEPMFRFLTTAGSEWDTPVTGGALPRPPIPGPDVFDLRGGRKPVTTIAGNPPDGRGRRHRSRGAAFDMLALFNRAPADHVSEWSVDDPDDAAIIGSNNWAVDGDHTESGVALVANDMHLDIGVPIIWYRALLMFPGVYGEPRRIAGVTLPGLPSMVVGSNGHVAWGFTNTGGDWSDLVRIDPDPRDRGKYLTPDGARRFEVYEETIAAKGAAAATITSRWTIWGPIVRQDAHGRDYAQRWVAHDPAVLASDITRPERARTVDDLVAAVSGLGMPNQNVTMGDDTGRIGWTVGGVIPRRLGHDGFTPQSWSEGTRRWNGYLSPAEFPRIVDPEGGRLWTANAPVVGGAMLATIGEGGYADGIRARLIRDRLVALDRATPKDMLAIQLEDAALFLERWRALLLDTLGKAAQGEAVAAAGGRRPSPLRAEFKRLLETTWTGRASPDSVAYRLVREFRTLFVRQMMTALTAPAHALDPEFDYTRSLRGEGPVWQILAARPLHLLDAAYASWDDYVLSVVDAVIANLTSDGQPLTARTWGEANRARFVHPLASAIPVFGPRLNMPEDPLPGDIYTPRAQTPRTGPSERMAVSPGLEHEGILHLPTGQSGHPLSPHYGDQYRAWLNGEPSPFLPGPAVSTLILTPR